MTAVIHVVTALERGGAQRNTLETAARLHDPGRPQIVVTGPRTGDRSLDDEAEARLGARLVRLPDLVGPVDPLRDAVAALSLARLIDRLVDQHGSPAIVHTHSSKAGVLGRLAARAVKGVYVVHTVHGFGLEALGARRRWILEAAERVAAPAADVVVFVSDADREEAVRLGIRGRHVTIRSGIDPAPFYAARAARSTAAAATTATTAVTVANLKPQKDPLFHVEILAAWRAIEPRARLVFAGDGPLRAEVEARARALGVRDALELTGFVDDTAPLLAAAGVFLLASSWEGLPRAVLEATAAGLPCVVRDSGWARDVAWAKNVTALDLGAPATAFAAALAGAGKARRAAPKLRRAFTLAGMLADLGALYDELIGPPRPTGKLRMPARSRGRRR